MDIQKPFSDISDYASLQEMIYSVIIDFIANFVSTYNCTLKIHEFILPYIALLYYMM